MGDITSGWALIQLSQLSFYWSSQYSENFVRTRASRNNTVKFLDMKNKILLFLSILIAILKNHTRQSDGKETNAVLANFFFFLTGVHDCQDIGTHSNLFSAPLLLSKKYFPEEGSYIYTYENRISLPMWQCALFLRYCLRQRIFEGG